MIRKHCQCFGKIDTLKKIINTAQNAVSFEKGEDTLKMGITSITSITITINTLKMGTRRRARTAVRTITIIILILFFYLLYLLVAVCLFIKQCLSLSCSVKH